MTTQAKLFAEEASKLGDDFEATTAAAKKYTFKVVKFTKHGNKRGLRFDDGSKLFFGNEGTLVLPSEDNK